MLFYLLFVITLTNAIYTNLKPEYAVALKGTPLLLKCCYDTSPAKFILIEGYTMINLLCGVRKPVIEFTGYYSYFSTDNLIPGVHQ